MMKLVPIMKILLKIILMDNNLLLSISAKNNCLPLVGKLIPLVILQLKCNCSVKWELMLGLLLVWIYRKWNKEKKIKRQNMCKFYLELKIYLLLCNPIIIHSRQILPLNTTITQNFFFFGISKKKLINQSAILEKILLTIMILLY